MFGFLSQMSTLEQKECIVRLVGPIVQLHFFHFCPSFQQFSIGTLVFFCSRVGQFALGLCHSTHDTLVLSSLQNGWIKIYSFERFLLPQTEKPLIYSKANHTLKLQFTPKQTMKLSLIFQMCFVNYRHIYQFACTEKPNNIGCRQCSLWSWARSVQLRSKSLCIRKYPIPDSINLSCYQIGLGAFSVLIILF